MTKIRTTRIVDKETGRIEHEYTREIRNPLYDDERGYLFQHNARAVRIFPGLPWPELTVHELAYLLKLARHLDEHNRIKALDAKGIAKLIGISLRRTYDFLYMMQGMRIIVKADTGYYMSPLYFFAGKYLSRELYEMFREDLAPLLSDWARERLEG